MRCRALAGALPALLLLPTTVAVLAQASPPICINDRRDPPNEAEAVGANYVGNAQVGGGTVTFLNDPMSENGLGQALPGGTSVGAAIDSAAQGWQEACPGSRFVPNFAQENRTRPEEGPVWATSAGVIYARNSKPNALPGGTNNPAYWESSRGVLWLAGLCERPSDSIGCKKVGSDYYINWGSPLAQSLIQHEIGHLLGLGHDSSSGSCSDFDGIMETPTVGGEKIKPEHCALANHRNCAEGVGDECPPRPETIHPPCETNGVKAGPCGGNDRIRELPDICQVMPRLCGGTTGTEPWWAQSFNPPRYVCISESEDYCNAGGCGSIVTVRCTHTYSPDLLNPPTETRGPAVFVGSVSGANAVVPEVVVNGWAAAATFGVSQIAFWLDGRPVTPSSSTYGLAAPEGCVGVADPHCPNVGFSAVIPTAGLAVGAHLLQVVAADGRQVFPGASLVDLPFSLSSTCGDIAPPNAAVTSPSAGATVSGLVTVAATATDNVGVTSVKFLLDGAVVATDPTAPFSWTWDTSTTGPGGHTLAARAFDACGNSRTSASVSVLVPSPPDIGVYQAIDGLEVPAGSVSTLSPTTVNVVTSRRYRIANLGGLPLSISNPTTLVAAQCLELSEVPATPLAAGGETFFRVRLLCGTPGTYSGTLTIRSNDPDEGAYSFSIVGTVTNGSAAAPDIAIYQAFDGLEVPAGSTSTLSPTTPYTATSKRFRIANQGDAALTVTNPNSLVSGACFSLSETPVSPVPPGGEAFFRVRLYCGGAGSYAGSVTVLSDDPDEPSYHFTVAGVVNPP